MKSTTGLGGKKELYYFSAPFFLFYGQTIPMAISVGKLPTGIVAITVFVAVSITALGDVWINRVQ
nr:hypothetical protein [Peribacillus sp. BBB004]